MILMAFKNNVEIYNNNNNYHISPCLLYGTNINNNHFLRNLLKIDYLCAHNPRGIY